MKSVDPNQNNTKTHGGTSKSVFFKLYILKNTVIPNVLSL